MIFFSRFSSLGASCTAVWGLIFTDDRKKGFCTGSVIAVPTSRDKKHTAKVFFSEEKGHSGSLSKGTRFGYRSCLHETKPSRQNFCLCRGWEPLGHRGHGRKTWLWARSACAFNLSHHAVVSVATAFIVRFGWKSTAVLVLKSLSLRYKRASRSWAAASVGRSKLAL